MKLVSLVVIIFPVTVAILALLIGYFMRQAENRIDPYGTADKLLLDATTLFDHGDSGWYAELNGTNWTVESTYTGDNSPLHRIRLRLESKKNVSTVFKMLTDESFLSSLYPALFASSQLTINNPKEFPMLSFDWIHGRLGLRYITSSTLWPFHDRSFALFSVVHPATHMFVSKTVPLSPLDKHILLPPKTLFKPTSNAELSIALRVSQELQQGTGINDTDGIYTVELLYHVSDFFGSANIDYFLTTAYFIPHVVAKIMQVLL